MLSQWRGQFTPLGSHQNTQLLWTIKEWTKVHNKRTYFTEHYIESYHSHKPGIQTSAISLYGIPSGLSEWSLSVMSIARHSSQLPTCSALQSTVTTCWTPGARTPKHGDNEKIPHVKCICKKKNISKLFIINYMLDFYCTLYQEL